MWFGKPQCGVNMKINKFKLGESSGGTMTSLHQFLSWLRERSKKAKMRQTHQHPSSTSDDGFPYGFSTHAPITAADVTHLPAPPPGMTFAPCAITAPLPVGPPSTPQRDSSARASMKLPPIPREAMRLKCAARNLHARQHTDSPAHVYEEISHLCMDPAGHRSPTPYESMPDEVPVDIQNLDFRHAQEFGPYLVVPIRDKMCGHLVFAHTADVSRPPDVSVQSGESAQPPSSGTLINPPTQDCARSYFPCDMSSSDSGFQSADGSHVTGHCLRCERPHGMYDGFSYTHIGPNDLQKLSCRVRGDVTYNVNNGDATRSNPGSDSSSRSSPVSQTVTHPALHKGHTTTNNRHRHNAHHDSHGVFHNAPHTMPHLPRCHTPHPSSQDSETSAHAQGVNIDVDGLESQFNKSVKFSDDVKEYKITNTSRSSAIEREARKYKSQSFASLDPSDAALKTRLSVQCESKDSPQHSTNNGSCPKVSPRSVSESDSGNSSVYAYSGSDKDAMSLPRSTSRHHESDSSNDTFSEYDIRSGEESPHSGEHTEYEYFLSKAKYNLWLKRDVLRVIRESESSDYDSTAVDVESDNDSNSSSLTTVTSLSDASILSQEGPLSEIVKCKLHQKHLRHRRHGKSSLSSALKHELVFDQGRMDECNDVEITGNKNDHRTEKSDRHVRSVCAKCGHTHSKRDHCKPSKKRTSKSSRSKVQEYYSLPDFPSSSHHDSEQPGPTRSAIELTQQEAKDFDALERLSCRATDYRPVGYKLPLPNTGGASVHAAAPEVPSSATLPNQKSSTLESTAKGPRRDQNRMLTDIMKMNHDRQLLFF